MGVPPQGFHKVAEDPCYSYYQEALACLDKNNYHKEFCSETFIAFKKCRARLEEQEAIERAQAMEKDPLLGWMFKLYNKHYGSSSNSSSGSGGGGSSSSSEGSSSEGSTRSSSQGS